MGTNTFNLLVVDVDGSRVSTAYHHKIGVMLGEGGINSGLISDEAYQRGLLAIDEYVRTAKLMGAETVKAYATSAIRSASNGDRFVGDVAAQYGLDVEVITGDREAELIYKGVAASMRIGEQRVLVLDIGGGSNELIICDQSGILWKQSFPLGMARIIERFKPSDPIRPSEVAAVEGFLTEGFGPLWDACLRYQPRLLVGASGAFDTLRGVLFASNDTEHPVCSIAMDEFQRLHQRFLASTLDERRLMPGMDELRVHLMVLASVTINLVLQKTAITQLLQSSYSLKEGAVVELIDGMTK